MKIFGRESATAFAPATVGNAGVGFDILGFALDTIGDTVTVARIDSPEVRIKAITGCLANLPMEPSQNTATAGLERLIEDRNLGFGFEVTIDKGIPLGSGMGGSAASAVGAIVAASALLEQPLSLPERFSYALIGEQVASGSAHGDNVAPCLYGGVTLIRSNEPVDIVRIPVPPAIRCVLVHPHLRIDTREARAMVSPTITLEQYVAQSAILAGFLCGCFTDDQALISRSLEDLIIEPQRASLIPGFADVKAAALASGAMSCTISGAGPSVFAWYGGGVDGQAIRDAMQAAFATVDLKSDGWLSSVHGLGAHLLL